MRSLEVLDSACNLSNIRSLCRNASDGSVRPTVAFKVKSQQCMLSAVIADSQSRMSITILGNTISISVSYVSRRNAIIKLLPDASKPYDWLSPPHVIVRDWCHKPAW
jgi:hypothetical protein